MQCDVLAQGVVDAAKDLKLNVPLVVKVDTLLLSVRIISNWEKFPDPSDINSAEFKLLHKMVNKIKKNFILPLYKKLLCCPYILL